MAIRRQIHFSRLLDIICGSALQGANTKVQKSAVYEDFKLAKLEENKLRSLIDANLPTFYVVNTETITDELVKGLGLNNFKENEDYVRQQFPSKQELKDFLLKTVTDAIKTLPTKSFVEDTFARRTTYYGYRRAANKFGSDMRAILKQSGIYIASDASTIIDLPALSYLVIGPTFNSVVAKVNDLLNKHLRDKFKSSYDINLKAYDQKANASDRFTIGDYINAGHTSAYTGSGDLIGINMPLAQEKQFLLSGDPKSEGLETAIADLYLNANYSITFKQNFTRQATNLLDMQFSFTITMPSKFNTTTLRTDEVRRIKNYIGDTILPTILEQAQQKFKGGIIEQVTLDSAASPSFYKYVEDLVKNTLKGEPTLDITKISTNSKTNSVAIKTHAIVKSKKPLKAKSSTGKIKISAQKIPKSVDSSLTSLQTLLNLYLVETVKQNMGTGTRRDVLNLRSGRFAESVNVERLTQGREGRRQQNPRSRDPKLLISKSIRELAQQLQITRLRAVLV
ncbi:MAG: hypothetical protein EBZ86_09430 [Synechococcaceae bacterium WB9_2_069]|nr:hypothetical protein [Synechococcaceae bacterium WB9_2_069]